MMNSPWHELRRLAVCEPCSAGVVQRQERWLQACLQRNANTHYGRRYAFSTITRTADYQRQVPLTRYDDLAEWIARIRDGEEDVLFSGRASAFEPTGGSTGGSKLIPYSEESFTDFRKAILPWLADLIDCHGIESGSAYFAISPVGGRSRELPSGIPIGITEGDYLGRDVQQLLAALSAVPPALAGMEDVGDWQLATLYHLVKSHDLVLVSVWSPTFFSMLLDVLETHTARLLVLYRDGGSIGGSSVAPDEGARKRLTAYLEDRSTKCLWPQLKLVSCWGDAASKPYYRDLQRRIPHAAFQPKGLLSTEGVVTVPNRKGVGHLAADSGFYEFLDDSGTARLCHELEAGETYEVVITTAGGLYRYCTGDRVVYRGMEEGLPLLGFTGRGSLVSDLVGEKLTEEFVSNCLVEIEGFRMLVPARSPKPRYLLVTDRACGAVAESAVLRVEEGLHANPQYAYARRIGQLDGLVATAIGEPLAHYVNTMHAQGARLGDIKVPALGCQSAWIRYLESLQ